MLSGLMSGTVKCEGGNESMKPILFPFTYIPDAVLTAMGTCFNRFVAYQPSGLSVPAAMRDLQDRGSLSIRMPVKSDANKLATVLKQYRSWADLHEGEGLTVFSSLGDGLPFFNDTSPSMIRSEIRPRNRKTAVAEMFDPLFEVSVFLQVAQELDRQNIELSLDLKQVGRKEQALFEDLKGEADEMIPGLQAGGLTPALEDPGTYMTSERMAAWTRLMLNDPEHSGIFVTTSPAIFNFIKEDAPCFERVLSIDLMLFTGSGTDENNLHRQSLMDKLEGFVGGTPVEEPAGSDAAVTGDTWSSLSIHKVPGTTPDEFFSRFVALNQADGNLDRSAGAYPNTLVCLLDIAPEPVNREKRTAEPQNIE